MKKIISISCCVILAGCAGGGREAFTTYQSVYDGYKRSGLSHSEAMASADLYCLNNPCRWGS